LSKLNSISNSNSNSGFENFDDCSIYKINDKQSIIQSLDFFTPIVDDPYTFGLISAANSISDIYAMGGKPLFALNIVAFPSDDLSLDVLSDILKGGLDKCKEANINILGGHSIKDKTPKYGLAVTGLIDNNSIIKNNTPEKLDVLLLTKPLGSGILTTAIKEELTDEKTTSDVINLMSTLNHDLSELNIKINACTDITGYGLLGHLNEMTQNNNLSANIDFNKVPFINEVTNFAKKDIIPGGTKKNLDFYKENILFANSISRYQQLMIADAQTSGGLLISTDKNNAKKLIEILNKKSKYKTVEIGYFSSKKEKNIIINNE
jgi:selenide,water dikinase